MQFKLRNVVVGVLVIALAVPLAARADVVVTLPPGMSDEFQVLSQTAFLAELPDGTDSSTNPGFGTGNQVAVTDLFATPANAEVSIYEAGILSDQVYSVPGQNEIVLISDGGPVAFHDQTYFESIGIPSTNFYYYFETGGAGPTTLDLSPIFYPPTGTQTVILTSDGDTPLNGVPEPPSLMLGLVGLLLVMAYYRRWLREGLER